MQAIQIQSLALPRDFRPTAQFGSIRATIAEWRRRLRERRELLVLTDRDLSDIGITRSDAAAEASKFFWHIGNAC
jgi:uncharacterized protein YjiS (DUF1127 family)